MSASKGNIVVVEDDPAMRLALGRFLKACGFRAQGFDSAEELLEDGAAANASCLIVDIHLTGLSGFELLKELRKRGTERPTIFITADEDSSLPSRSRPPVSSRNPLSARVSWLRFVRRSR